MTLQRGSHLCLFILDRLSELLVSGNVVQKILRRDVIIRHNMSYHTQASC